MKIRGEPPTLYLTRPHKGPIMVAYHAGKIVVKKWPRKRPNYAKNPTTASQVATWDAVQEWVRSPVSQELDQAYKDQTGTAFYARDALVSAAYGNYVSWPGWGWKEVFALNIQQLLNSITTVDGSLVLRASAAWVGLGPGAVGQVLTVTSNDPPVEWVDPAAPVGGLALVGTLVASGSASLAWTGLTGKRYRLCWSTLAVATTTQQIRLQSGSGSTPTWNTSANYNSLTTAGQTGISLSNNSTLTSAGGLVWGSIDIDLDNISEPMVAHGTSWGSTGSALFNAACGGDWFGDGLQTTALRIIAGSGNLAKGTASLYSYAT